ncbi:MAG: dTDP-4-dehydrorhamnose 3,5-epimerase [Candidatus Gastranaerophilales bacterium]|nr:dTDP-4-dehydrorhamnose 3,5-epimerase [Candidatus Gastranaerophilales bacterium]
MPFEFKKLNIPDVVLVIPKVFDDDRGFFLEGYKKSEFKANGIYVEFNQDNHSKSSKGVLRGLHYQAAPKAQAKLVRCIQGEIFDVAVDIRRDSDSFGKWVGEKLSAQNKHMLFIPEGFAHGFVVLSETAELLYKASNEFSKEHDRGVRWNDSDINVNWGIDFVPLLSEKDKNQPFLKDIKD